MKTCSQCGEQKSLEEFNRDSRKLDGRRAECTLCTRLRMKKRILNKPAAKRQALKRHYNLSIEEFEFKYNSQQGRCAICKKSVLFSGTVQNRTSIACVDHDHITNKVRGLLCNNCNRALGLFQDSPEILESALSYLKEYKDDR